MTTEQTTSNQPNGTTYSHLFVFSGSNKAGMEQSDKQKQADVIYQMSKNSKFFEHENKQDLKRKSKIEEIKRKVSDMKDTDIHEMNPRIDNIIISLEEKRNLNRMCVVFDMDMFFAAVAIRDRPHLVDKPVAVGGMSMISTTNYVARKHGVRSAMPGFIGKRLCPELIFVEHEGEKYAAASKIVGNIIREYDPDFKSYSLDEFFVDLTDAVNKKLGEGHTEIPVISKREVACGIAEEIRSRIRVETGGLTSSAGLANNFMLAKICADVNKPNGQFSLPPERSAVLEFMDTLPCRRVGGVGRVTEKALSELGMSTMGEVRRGLNKVVFGFTESQGKFLTRASLGIGSEEVNDTEEKESRGRKSVGAERTFSAIQEPALLMAKLLELCGTVSSSLEKKNLYAGSLTLKLKSVNFEVTTRRYSYPRSRFVRTTDDLFAAASKLLTACLPVHVRLMGVQAGRLSSTTTGRPVLSAEETPLGRLLSRQTVQSMPEGSGKRRREEEGNEEVINRSHDRFSWEESSCGSDHSLSYIGADEDSRDQCIYQEERDHGLDNEISPWPVLLHTSRSSNSDVNGYLGGSDRTAVSTSSSSADVVGTVSSSEVNCTAANDSPIERCTSSSSTGPSSVELKTSFSCPICGDRSSRSLLSLNIHLDKCLLRAKTKKKNITSYFGVCK